MEIVSGRNGRGALEGIERGQRPYRCMCSTRVGRRENRRSTGGREVFVHGRGVRESLSIIGGTGMGHHMESGDVLLREGNV